MELVTHLPSHTLFWFSHCNLVLSFPFHGWVSILILSIDLYLYAESSSHSNSCGVDRCYSYFILVWVFYCILIWFCGFTPPSSIPDHRFLIIFVRKREKAKKKPFMHYQIFMSWVYFKGSLWICGIIVYVRIEWWQMSEL